MASETEKLIIALETQGFDKLLSGASNVEQLRRVIAALKSDASATTRLADLDAAFHFSDQTLARVENMTILLARLANARRDIATFDAAQTVAKENKTPFGGYKSQDALDKANVNLGIAEGQALKGVFKEILGQAKAVLKAEEAEAKAVEDSAKAAAQRAFQGREAARRLREALNAQRLEQVDAAIANRPVTNFPDAYRPQNAQGQFRARTALEQAQVGKDTADTELRRANLALANERRNTTRDEASLDAAIARQVTASKDATAASEKLATEEKSLADAQAVQAQAARLAAVDASLAQRTQAFPNADVNTHLGRAQSAVNAADDAVQIASLRLAEVRKSETVSDEGVLAATRTLQSATRAAAVAREQVALLETRGSGSFIQQFKTGFHGTNSDRGYAEQIGQAFKFSVFYGTAYRLLSGITATLSDALHEGIAFQEAMTELSIASGQSATEMDSLRKNLGDSATQAGFAPSQGVLIGARSLGLFGATQQQGASATEQNRIAELSARTISRAAFSSGLQPEDIQRDIAAIAQAFQQGPAGQTRAFDLDAYLTKYFGQPAGSTYQAVSESATAGRAAGFSQEQVTAIAAELQARTGQDAGTIAGYMAQIFSRSGEGALLGVEQKYGVDSTTTLATQIKNLAQVYKDTPSARDEISAVFGRGKSQNASIALLQGYGAIETAAGKATTQATGAGDKIFGQRLDNIGGQLQVLFGDLKSFNSELGRSGILAGLGLAAKVLDEFVKAATGLLQAWNSMNGVVRALIATLLLEEAVRRSGIVGGIAGRATGLLGKAGAAAQGAGGATLISGGAGGIGGAAAGAEGGGLAAAAVAALPAALSVAAIAAAGLTLVANRKLDEASATTTDALRNQFTGTNYDPATLQSQAAALQSDADQAREAAHGIFAHIIDLGKKSDADYQLASQAQAESQRLAALAAYKQSAAANVPSSQGVIPSFGTDELSTSLQGLTANGANAQDRLDAVAASLGGAAGAAARFTAAFDPHIFAGDNAKNAFNALLKTGYVGQTETPSNGFSSVGNFLKNVANNLPGAPGVDRKYVNALPGALQGTGLTPGVLAQREEAALRSRGIASANDITGPAAASIANEVLGTNPEQALKSLGITDPENIAKYRALLVKALRRSLLDQAKSVKDIIAGRVTLSGADQVNAVAEIGTETQGILSSLPQTDHTGRAAALKRDLNIIRHAVRDSPGGAVSSTQDAIDQARVALSNEQIAELEDLRKAAQQSAKNKKDVRNIGRSFFTREVNAAIRGRNTDALVNLVNTAGDYGKRIVKAALEEVLKTAQAAAAMASEFAAYAANEAADITGHIQLPGKGASGPNAQQQKLLDYIHNVQGIIDGTYHGNNSTDNFGSGGDANLPKGLQPDTGATKTPGPTAAQIAAARQSALAAGSESQIAQARASVATARADMTAAKKGTTEYYSALGAYLSARNDLTDAIQAYHQNLYLLGHDATNPVVQARAALRAAEQKLRADRGKPADVRAADRVAVNQARADAESTAFNQRLEAVQTAEQLGRTSYSAYISYLNHERDRLRGIAHRSYQQQQELNQIDGLIKDAADQMQGQWNFGDIHLPTPYQVRRSIEAHSGYQDGGGGGGGAVFNDGPKHPPGGDTHYVRINIDGADTGAIIRILKNVLGTNVVASSGGGRHR